MKDVCLKAKKSRFLFALFSFYLYFCIRFMRYFITLSYDGTRFHGWQVQPNGISVQGELQHALSLLLRSEVAVTGAA